MGVQGRSVWEIRHCVPPGFLAVVSS